MKEFSVNSFFAVLRKKSGTDSILVADVKRREEGKYPTASGEAPKQCSTLDIIPKFLSASRRDASLGRKADRISLLHPVKDASPYGMPDEERAYTFYRAMQS